MNTLEACALPLLLSPRRISKNLERIRLTGRVPRVPNVWQVGLGVTRMWHRVLFRPETIGTSVGHAVRNNWRARLLARRPIRFPFLLAERAVAPWDFSGLISDPERIVRHLLGAHHDGKQFAYDLELLHAYGGEDLERVRRGARRVVDREDARSRWLRDLTVYERYHERLLASVEAALRGDFGLDEREARSPDLSFVAYLGWCASQPETPLQTLRALGEGRLRLSSDPLPATAPA
jgi:hypothetical protein